MGKQNRDIPLGGPTTVTDTTSYGRPQQGIIILPESKSPSKKEQKAAKQQEKEAGEALKKAKENLDKNFLKPLNPRA